MSVCSEAATVVRIMFFLLFKPRLPRVMARIAYFRAILGENECASLYKVLNREIIAALF
jgi:hypothetical protein